VRSGWRRSSARRTIGADQGAPVRVAPPSALRRRATVALCTQCGGEALARGNEIRQRRLMQLLKCS
jgi:hypothetical protein